MKTVHEQTYLAALSRSAVTAADTVTAASAFKLLWFNGVTSPGQNGLYQPNVPSLWMGEPIGYDRLLLEFQHAVNSGTLSALVLTVYQKHPSTKIMPLKTSTLASGSLPAIEIYNRNLPLFVAVTTITGSSPNINVDVFATPLYDNIISNVA